MPIKKSDLSAPDLMVLEALTASRSTPSTVTLAADLWDPKDNPLGADPVGFVQWVLDGLCERGLVTMRVKESRTPKEMMTDELRGLNPYEHFAFGIRLSRDGWELMGYPQVHAQVFTRLSTGQNEPTTGDRTRFRTHRSSAEGSPIYVDTFAEHQHLFPGHIHDYEMAGDDMATRRYLRMTDELENEIRVYATTHQNLTHPEIADALGVSDRTIKYVLTDLPRIRRKTDDDGEHAGSQKQRILWALEIADHLNVTSLRKALGRTDTNHDIVHALHDLHTEGKVDFDEKSGRDEPIRIHITDRGRNSIKPDDNELLPKRNGTMATIEEPLPDFVAERIPKVLTEKSVSRPTYPELDKLLAREKVRLDTDERAMRYMEAAELIRATDPETAKLLDDKAADNDIPFPSPVEAEYLTYVANHPDVAGDDGPR